MLKLSTSEYLDQCMDSALARADVLDWTDEGKVVFVRKEMDAAYERAQRLEMVSG